jgi:hypothetical protein
LLIAALSTPRLVLPYFSQLKSLKRDHVTQIIFSNNIVPHILIDLKSGNRAGYGAANLSRICGELDRCVDYFLLVVFERKTSKDTVSTASGQFLSYLHLFLQDIFKTKSKHFACSLKGLSSNAIFFFLNYCGHGILDDLSFD